MSENKGEITLTAAQEKFIRLVLEPSVRDEKGRLVYAVAKSWAFIAGQRQVGALSEDLRAKINALQRKYLTINAWLAEQILGDKGRVKELFELGKSFENAHEIWQVQGLAEYEFKGFAGFYKWYLKQPCKQIKCAEITRNEKCCALCGATKWELERDLKNKNIFNFLYLKSKFAPILRVVKKDSKEGYKPDNCVLGCVVCTRAKGLFADC